MDTWSRKQSKLRPSQFFVATDGISIDHPSVMTGEIFCMRSITTVRRCALRFFLSSRINSLPVCGPSHTYPRFSFFVWLHTTQPDGLLTPRWYNLVEHVSEERTLPIAFVKAIAASTVYSPFANGLFLAGARALHHGPNVRDAARPSMPTRAHRLLRTFRPTAPEIRKQVGGFILFLAPRETFFVLRGFRPRAAGSRRYTSSR